LCRTVELSNSRNWGCVESTEELEGYFQNFFSLFLLVFCFVFFFVQLLSFDSKFSKYTVLSTDHNFFVASTILHVKSWTAGVFLKLLLEVVLVSDLIKQF
jgi:hypothetical protein